MVRMLGNVKAAKKKACEFFRNLSGRFWGCSWGRARLSIEIQIGYVRSSLNVFRAIFDHGKGVKLVFEKFLLRLYYLFNKHSRWFQTPHKCGVLGVLDISRSLIALYILVGLSIPLKIRKNRRKTIIPVTIFDVLTGIFCFLTSIFLFSANFYAVWKKSLFDLVKKWRFYDG